MAVAVDTSRHCECASAVVSHIEKKRRGSESRRPIADMFISAFAQRFQGLITRNPKDFESARVVVS